MELKCLEMPCLNRLDFDQAESLALCSCYDTWQHTNDIADEILVMR